MLREEGDIKEPWDILVFGLIVTIILYYSLKVLKQMLGIRFKGQPNYRFNEPDFSEMGYLKQ